MGLKKKPVKNRAPLVVPICALPSPQKLISAHQESSNSSPFSDSEESSSKHAGSIRRSKSLDLEEFSGSSNSSSPALRKTGVFGDHQQLGQQSSVIKGGSVPWEADILFQSRSNAEAAKSGVGNALFDSQLEEFQQGFHSKPLSPCMFGNFSDSEHMEVMGAGKGKENPGIDLSNCGVRNPPEDPKENGRPAAKDAPPRKDFQNRTFTKLFDDLPSKRCKYVSQQGNFVSVSKQHIHAIDEAWGACLLARFVGITVDKYMMNAVKGVIRQPFKYFMHSSGWIVLKFSDNFDKIKALEGGPYMIRGKALVLKEIPKLFSFGLDEMTKVPVWVRLKNLPLELWNCGAISEIASFVGKPIQVDDLTLTRSVIEYGRVLVEVDVSRKLPTSVEVKSDDGSFVQVFEYEDLPLFCNQCGSIGHANAACEKQNHKTGNDMVVNLVSAPRTIVKQVAKKPGQPGTVPVAAATSSRPHYVPVKQNLTKTATNLQDVQHTSEPPVCEAAPKPPPEVATTAQNNPGNDEHAGTSLPTQDEQQTTLIQQPVPNDRMKQKVQDDAENIPVQVHDTPEEEWQTVVSKSRKNRPISGVKRQAKLRTGMMRLSKPHKLL